MTESAEPAQTQLDEVRHLVGHATHRLLGDTIALSDDAWRAPSRLPGWSRGHVATHVARQADGLRRLCSWAMSGERTDMYASSSQRDAEIEAGADRSGLDLQIDLDTSAGELGDTFDAVTAAHAWDAEVEMRGGLRVRARALPLGRLTEVVLHHVDLDCGFGVDDIDETVAAWLLEWSAFRLRPREEFPKLHLTSPSGLDLHLGSSGQQLSVRGSNQRLLGWLTSRTSAEELDGTGGLKLPAF